MADRIYKGCLITHYDEPFPESARKFNSPHAGGLVPFDVLREVLMVDDPCLTGSEDVGAEYKMIGDSLWLGRGEVWIKIDPDGTIEIGASGA